jgi:hypothetical protein
MFSMLGSGCQRPAPPTGELLTKSGPKPLDAGLETQVSDSERTADFENQIRFLGAKMPEALKLGESPQIRLYFKVLEPLQQNPKIFVHGHLPGAERNQIGADHVPTTKGIAPSDWRVGDVIEDVFSLTVPATYPADQVILHIGLYDGKKRFRVTKGQHDGKNRIHIGTLKVVDGPPSFPTATANRTTGQITIDGKMDEPDWIHSQKLGPFIRHDGRTQIKNKTYARLLWDADHLYVFFECDDADIHTPYTKRDDPLYESEAVEIFIDADGDRDEYVELQAAPNNVHFDAAFRGGRRKNFDTSYNVNYESKSQIEGTLNEPGDTDKRWTSEWKIPISELRDIPAPVQKGATWKINLFRLDRFRRGEKVVGSEATAWSSPYSGDFHNLDRFGKLVFAGPVPAEKPKDNN